MVVDMKPMQTTWSWLFSCLLLLFLVAMTSSIVDATPGNSPTANDHQGYANKDLDADCDNEGSCFKCFIGSEQNYDFDNYCYSSANNCTMTVAPDGRITRGCSNVKGSLSDCIWEDGYRRCYCTKQFCNSATVPLSLSGFAISIILHVLFL